MKAIKPKRDRWLTVRLNTSEEAYLLKKCQKTTCQSLSAYARRVLFQKPVTLRYRNASADDFLEEIVRLKKELRGISSHAFHALRQARDFDHIADVKQWMAKTSCWHAELVKKTDEILVKANEIHRLWSQK